MLVVHHRIAQAGDTLAPALLALESLGYTITIDGDLMVASLNDTTFVAQDPVALLGLVKLVEVRTWAWKASDNEIDEALSRYRLE
jgi:hypothetical protein